MKEEAYFQGNFDISVHIRVKLCNPILSANQNLCSLQHSIHKSDIWLLIFIFRVLGIAYRPFNILHKNSTQFVHHLWRKNTVLCRVVLHCCACMIACIILLSSFKLSESTELQLLLNAVFFLGIITGLNLLLIICTLTGTHAASSKDIYKRLHSLQNVLKD